MKALAGSLAIVVSVLGWTPSRAVVLGQVDDFEDGTVMGWVEGGLSPNPPTNVSSGGPAGLGDNFLQDVSTGLAGAGGKMVMFNQSQWAGNYLAAGVDRIDLHMRNFGATTLNMRIAIEGGVFSTKFGSTTAVVLPAGGAWTLASFGLTASDLTLISGADSLSTVLSGVGTLRVLSAAAGPAFNGDTIAGRLGVDNITAGGSAAAPPPPVPDGRFGSPMLASRGNADGSLIQLSWDVTTCKATDYHILFGSLSTVSSLVLDGGVCAIGDSGTFDWAAAPAGDLWFLPVGNDGVDTEGSWGRDSADAERGGNTVSGECGMVDRDNTGTCP